MSQRVTWLLAVKDGMPYLPKTLESIARQTYTDQEILAWDNGSTDGTVEELRSWIPSRIPGRVVADQPLPLAQSRAMLVETATTELCAIIDADDLADPDRLQIQVDHLTAHPEIAVLGTQMRDIDADGLILEPRVPYPTNHDDIVNRMLVENPIGQPSVLFRRSAVLETGNYQPVGEVNIEDYDLWMRMAVRYKLENLPQILTSYRVHSKSTTQVMIARNRLLGAVNHRMSMLAPELFGVSSPVAFKLRERRLTYSMPAIKKMAAHLDATQHRSVGSTIKQLSFLESARYLVWPWDRVTGFQMALLNPYNRRLEHELKSFLYAVSPKLGLMTPIIRFVRRQKKEREKRRLRSWAEDLGRSLPAEIDNSLVVTGREDFSDFMSFGKYGWIERDVTIWISPDDGAEPQLTVGSRTFIGQHTFIGVYKPVSIGNYTMIGAYSYIISASHRYERRDIPIVEQGFTGKPVVLEDDVWLGTHVVVLPGVTIGRGAIVAAGSIVNKSIPPYEVWGGVPARFIKQRPQ